MNLMKLYSLYNRNYILTFFIVMTSFMLSAQGAWNPERLEDSKKAYQKMLEDSPKLESFANEAYGYAVFPKVTKAGIGVGGAAGRGIVFKGGNDVGTASLKQASIGLQLGGQQYSEVIFFGNKESYDHFINGNLKFGAQASAVAITVGASIDAAYINGVAVFTRVKGGLMYEASIGGQHFKYEPKEL